MPAKKTTKKTAAKQARTKRTDAEKLAIVRQVMASDNQTQEIKNCGIYPNQFYDWKKKLVDAGGAPAAQPKTAAVKAPRVAKVAPRASTKSASSAVADSIGKARAFIDGKAALLAELRGQYQVLGGLIHELDGEQSSLAVRNGVSGLALASESSVYQ